MHKMDAIQKNLLFQSRKDEKMKRFFVENFFLFPLKNIFQLIKL